MAVPSEYLVVCLKVLSLWNYSRFCLLVLSAGLIQIIVVGILELIYLYGTAK